MELSHVSNDPLLPEQPLQADRWRIGLHEIAQPLTSLLLLLEEAGLLSEAETRADLLEAARNECYRAVAALRRLQADTAGRPRESTMVGKAHV